MKDSGRIRLLIVEDDQVQSDLLAEKLMEHYKDYQIESFKSGDDLIAFLNSSKKRYVNYYLILDYFLQTEDNKNGLNGLEVIEFLGKHHFEIRTIIHSAYENDDSLEFTTIPEKHSNVIGVVKKSEYGFVSLQNIIRFDFYKAMLVIKRKRFTVARVVFGAIAILSLFYFISLYFL